MLARAVTAVDRTQECPKHPGRHIRPFAPRAMKGWEPHPSMAIRSTMFSHATRGREYLPRTVMNPSCESRSPSVGALIWSLSSANICAGRMQCTSWNSASVFSTYADPQNHTDTNPSTQPA